MSCPTDLSPAEELRARARLAEPAEQFTAKEILRALRWREVFERTWRHPYVPAYYPDKDTPPVLCIDGPRREEWLDAVYSDTTLITKLMPVPLARPLRPALGMTYTSPPAWLEQAAPGAVILTDVHGPLGGTLARLTVDEHGTATGRFLPHWAGFMTMRHDIEPTHPYWPVLELPATRSWTTIDPLAVNTHGLFGFILQWQLPEVTQGRMTDDGQPAVFLLSRDGSRAEVATTATARGYAVRQCGPQRLWDRVENAATFWNEQGRPSYERFGITATPQDQYVWYDQPTGPHRWPLP